MAIGFEALITIDGIEFREGCRISIRRSTMTHLQFIISIPDSFNRAPCGQLGSAQGAGSTIERARRPHEVSVASNAPPTIWNGPPARGDEQDDGYRPPRA